MKKKLLAIFGSVIVLAMILAACAPAEPAEPGEEPTPETIVETVVVTEEVVVTEVVTEIVEVEVTPEVTRNGAWLDTVIMIAEPSMESAVARIIADDIDVYAQSGEEAEAFATVQEEGLSYVNTVGSYKEITFNPVKDLNDGTLNPWGIPAVREAVNKLVDRDYIAQEIMGGLGLPKTLPLTGVFPDYANFAAVARELETMYAYDPEAAGETINNAVVEAGAELVDGVLQFNGEPIESIFLIRTEDTRLPIGDYVANQIEEYTGITVVRDYKTSSEAAPLWLQSDPADGLWHLYTGGWITTAIDRNQVTLLGDFYTYLGWPGNPLWTAYETTDEFFEIADTLYNSLYTSVEERAELFEQGLYLAMENGNRVWLVDDLSFSPFDTDVSVTYDLAGGISGTPLAARTLRFKDQVGGEMVYAMSDLLVEPWNPLNGSNWIYDMAPMRMTGDFGTVADPYTGLALPQRVESAAIVAEEGLPIGITYDWLTLEFQPEVQVPGDAWVDWNAADQVFVTADEKLTAMSAMPAMETDPGSIVDVAVADGRFTTLAAALTAAELVETLSGEGPFTVFAPTDDAFAALPEGTVEALLEDIPALTDILLYHVVGGYAPASKVLEMEALSTLLGKNVEISLDEEGNPMIGDAMIVLTDVMANNGVIHVIDAVLLPPEGDEEDPAIPLYPEYFTSKIKSTVTYPADMFETVKWHDGSPLSVGDFVMAMILLFDQGMEDSAIFDESQVGSLASFMSSFKGMKIASTDPLVIEYYTDNWQLDAENNVTSLYPGSVYPQGEGSWDMLAIGILAETDLELAFSADKAEANDIEYMSYISGPSLEVLRAKLGTAIEETYIPYAPTLGQYITAEEAADRYDNLLGWYQQQGHFFINTGPFYLNKVFPVEKTLTLTRFQDYPDSAAKWAGFGTPKIAEVEIDGPGRVTIGEEAVFDAYVTFEGEPYASGDLKEVKYLVFDATNALVDSGTAEMVEEGLYSVTLSADATGALEAGSNKIEFIAVPLVVSVPTFEALEFVTAE